MVWGSFYFWPCVACGIHPTKAPPSVKVDSLEATRGSQVPPSSQWLRRQNSHALYPLDLATKLGIRLYPSALEARTEASKAGHTGQAKLPHELRWGVGKIGYPQCHMLGHHPPWPRPSELRSRRHLVLG